MPKNQLPKSASKSKGELTASRILDSAESQFAACGFAGTSLREVAQLAGIQKASLYNYFSSKDDLYSAVLWRGFEPMLAVMQSFINEGDKAYDNPQLLETFIDVMSQRPNFARLLQFESLQGGEKLKGLLDDWIKQGLAQGEQAMRGSDHSHLWEPEELRLLIFYTFTMILGYFTLAPLYELYTGEQSQTKSSIARQKRFLRKMWARLWYQSK